jgi:hypothetical protein
VDDSQLIWEAYENVSDDEGFHYTLMRLSSDPGGENKVMEDYGPIGDKAAEAIAHTIADRLGQQGKSGMMDTTSGVNPETGEWELQPGSAWPVEYEDFMDYEGDDTSGIYSPEEEEKWKEPGWNYMSTLYDLDGIPKAEGQWSVGELYALVKHPPVPSQDNDYSFTERQ